MTSGPERWGFILGVEVVSVIVGVRNCFRVSNRIWISNRASYRVRVCHSLRIGSREMAVFYFLNLSNVFSYPSMIDKRLVGMP